MLRVLLICTSLIWSLHANAYDGEEHGEEHGEGSHGFTIDELPDVTKLALDTFKELEPELAKEIFAFTSQIRDETAAITLYRNGLEGLIRVNLTCHKHDGLTECHKQGH